MLPLLEAYSDANSPISIMDLMPIMASNLELTEEELAERLPSGRQGLFHNRLHWAKTYMARAGLIDSPSRGMAEITDRGRSLLGENLEKIDGATLSQFDEFTEWKDASKANNADDSPNPTKSSQVEPEASTRTPEERIEAARKDLERGLKAELLDRVRSMTPADFEELIVQLLLRMGYGLGAEELAEAIGGSGDQGLDGVVHQDPLGLDRVYIQAKRYARENTIGRDEVQKFVGALAVAQSNKGVFITTSSYSKGAIEYAENLNGTSTLVLIDGNNLAEYIYQYNLGMQTEQTIEIKKLDSDFWDSIDDADINTQ